MKQYLTPEQTAKLIELGLPKPKSMNGEYNGWQFMPTPAYSIGELIEMLPRTIKRYYDLCVFSTAQGWWVLYGLIGDGDMWSIEYEIYRNELIDSLYDMLIKLKEEPQDLCDGMHIMGYKYKVETGKHCCMCFDLFHAVKIWFYTLFSRL